MAEFYSYEGRKGIRAVSWEDFFGICKGLALAVSSFDPEIILGIARGGLYPATLLSHLLQRELYAIPITSRFNDQVIYDTPRWLVKPPSEVRDKRVLIVDEISGHGITLQMAKAEVEALGSKQIKTAVMYAHESGQQVPDYIGFVSDELILNPWDREVLRDGKFVLHPEYVYALEKQGVKPDGSILIGVEPHPIVKARA